MRDCDDEDLFRQTFEDDCVTKDAHQRTPVWLVIRKRFHLGKTKGPVGDLAYGEVEIIEKARSKVRSLTIQIASSGFDLRLCVGQE